MSKNMHIRIVPMTTDHLDAVAALERICFSDPWSRNLLAAELDNDLSAFLVALDGEGEVAGYAGLQVVLDEGTVTNIAVRPDCQPAFAGVFEFRPGKPAGLPDSGGPGLQLRCHRPLRQPGLSQRGAEEELL